MAAEEITRREILRRPRASPLDISTIPPLRPSQMHPSYREVAVRKSSEAVPTLRLHSSQCAVLEALMQVGEVASISIEVLEQANVHLANIFSSQDAGRQIPWIFSG